ncbi:hypothetical protein BaRGS_00031975, partial [Batillaria attramentaria]
KGLWRRQVTQCSLADFKCRRSFSAVVDGFGMELESFRKCVVQGVRVKVLVDMDCLKVVPPKDFQCCGGRFGMKLEFQKV